MADLLDTLGVAVASDIVYKYYYQPTFVAQMHCFF